ncbi:hypothetical protein [Thalassobacillus sp. CUG 92003]|uniref:hypothetical protein n=1 Tax=Thalassobacillus sp. CUG 92003 TaxID=2736641 RepID=UPI0015E7D2DD|nr:hypothetical protein [Thalassobacillus sp. CUG 92003]
MYPYPHYPFELEEEDSRFWGGPFFGGPFVGGFLGGLLGSVIAPPFYNYGPPEPPPPPPPYYYNQPYNYPPYGPYGPYEW